MTSLVALADLWMKNFPVLEFFEGRQFFLCGPVNSDTLLSLDHVCRRGLHVNLPKDWLGHLPQLQILRIQTAHFQSKVMTHILTVGLSDIAIQQSESTFAVRLSCKR